ncbi:hypothetical protein PEDI_04560 [Persicobacter diffluens]|uniref:Uncharacterized protein n=1 Tax=Persicobacter diffluens TaxID=981 RepID=A0AAN5AIH4_9BACT|nr:hypothetical protein PEDI_04560 [Persicobacter diffluens]
MGPAFFVFKGIFSWVMRFFKWLIFVNPDYLCLNPRLAARPGKGRNNSLFQSFSTEADKGGESKYAPIRALKIWENKLKYASFKLFVVIHASCSVNNSG